VRLGEVDDAADQHREHDRDDTQTARPRAWLPVVALAEDVIIQRRTPVIKSGLSTNDTWPASDRIGGRHHAG
jgi:hypothetical protein